MSEKQKPLQFNVNNHVRVRLTDYGRAIHRRNHEELFRSYPAAPQYRPPEEDADGWSRWQMWDLMHQFGDHLYNGAPVPFMPTIEILEWEVA